MKLHTDKTLASHCCRVMMGHSFETWDQKGIGREGDVAAVVGIQDDPPRAAVLEPLQTQRDGVDGVLHLHVPVLVVARIERHERLVRRNHHQQRRSVAMAAAAPRVAGHGRNQ